MLFQHQTMVWSMVSTSSMPVFESRSPYLFSNGERRDRKNNAICKYRTEERFDDYFLCKKNECKLKHVRQWFYLFINQNNREVSSKINRAGSKYFKLIKQYIFEI
jgi:hypothetical protein